MNPLFLTLNTSKLITASFSSATATNPPPVFQSVSQTGGTLTFTWSAVLGRAYQVQYKINLLQTNWSDWGSPITATNSTSIAADAVGLHSERFYRGGLLP